MNKRSVPDSGRQRDWIRYGSTWPWQVDGPGQEMAACRPMANNLYRGSRFPAGVIEHAVWLYHWIVVSRQSIREWSLVSAGCSTIGGKKTLGMTR